MTAEVIDLAGQFRERAHIELVRAMKDEVQMRRDVCQGILQVMRSNGINPALCPSVVTLFTEVDKQIQFLSNERIAVAKKMAGIVDAEDVVSAIDWTAKAN